MAHFSATAGKQEEARQRGEGGGRSQLDRDQALSFPLGPRRGQITCRPPRAE